MLTCRSKTQPGCMSWARPAKHNFPRHPAPPTPFAEGEKDSAQLSKGRLHHGQPPELPLTSVLAQRRYQDALARETLTPNLPISGLATASRRLREHGHGKYKRDARCGVRPGPHELLPLLSP
jgi:hypothetical protein